MPTGRTNSSSSKSKSSSSKSKTKGRGSPTSQKRKKRKKKSKSASEKSKSASDDEDQEPKPNQIGHQFYKNRREQRMTNHPISSIEQRNRKSDKKRKAAEALQQERTEREATSKLETDSLKIQLARLQKRIKLDDGEGGTKKKGGESSAMHNLVEKTVKTKLWKLCKFLKGKKKLNKATRFIMNQLHLKEMDDLDPTERAEAEEMWIKKLKDTVRKALNSQRNYVQQEIREWCETKWKDGTMDHLVPNVEEIYQLAVHSADLNNPVVMDAEDKELNPYQDPDPEDLANLDADQEAEVADQKAEHEKLRAEALERRRYRGLFEAYWDELMPKVAGTTRWSPSKRHYGTLSYTVGTGKARISSPL